MRSSYTTMTWLHYYNNAWKIFCTAKARKNKKEVTEKNEEMLQ